MKPLLLSLLAAMLGAMTSAQGNILWESPTPPNAAAWSVAAAGDVNGDGVPDVIAGEFYTPNWGPGWAKVFSGVDGSVLWTFSGTSVQQGFGNAVAGAGDVDGDGFADVIVGAYGWGSLPPDPIIQGSAYVYSGATGALLNSFSGGPGHHLGSSVGGGADFNGDGLDDVTVGASCHSGSGNGYVKIFSVLTGLTITTISGTPAPFSTSGEFGRSHAIVGDVDGDSIADIIGGNIVCYNSQGGGAAAVCSGASGNVLFTLIGTTPCGGLGTDVAGVGDVDGDGVPDVAATDNGIGSSTIIASGATGAILQTLNEVNKVSGLGDLDGDGVPEVIAGNNGTIYSPGAGWANLGSVVQGGRFAKIGDVNGDGIPDLAAKSGNSVKVILMGLGYQQNSAAATLQVDGQQGSANVPAGASLPLNALAMLTLASTNTGMPWELGLGVAPLVSQATGAFTTVGGQIVNLDFTDPTFGVLWNYFQSPGFANAVVPFSIPSAAKISAQMLIVDTSMPTGVSISQPVRLTVQ